MLYSLDLKKRMLSPVRSAVYYFSFLFGLLLFSGWLLGYFHDRQWVLFTILATVGTAYLWHQFSINIQKGAYKLVGFLLTSMLGTSCELWGTYNEYWIYHDIPANQLIPVWIPVAWGFTYFAFHLFEKSISQLVQGRKLTLFAFGFISLVLPTIGEYIPIYMHVWTYQWPYQFMGVPILASLGIWTVHIVVFFTMAHLNKRYAFEQQVYTKVIPIT